MPQDQGEIPAQEETQAPEQCAILNEIDAFWRDSSTLMDPTTWAHLVARRDELKARLVPLIIKE